MAQEETISDVEIVAQVLEGQQDAYALLVRRHQNRLRSVISAYCHSGGETEEIVQEALVQAYLHLKQFQREKEFFPWLRVIGMNCLRMKIRRSTTERERGAEYLRRVQMETAEQDAGGEDADQRAHFLNRCMEKMGEASATLLRNRYVDGVSIRELALRLQTTVNTLTVRIHRLKQVLERCIEEKMSGPQESEE